MVLCELLGGVRLVSQDEIEHAVERYIRERYRGSTSEVNVEFRSVPRDMAARGGRFTLRIPESTGMPLVGNFSVPVEVVSQGRVEHRCIVSVKVRTFDTVLVAARQLGRHENLKSSDVRREKLETTSLKSVPLREDRQLVGLRTTRIINAGCVLTGDLTQAVPDVLQGSPVTLLVKGRNFRLSLDAVAKEDGVRGRHVMVQRVGGTARLQATVLDPKTVEMRVQ